jgi:hypothetical protein
VLKVSTNSSKRPGSGEAVGGGGPGGLLLQREVHALVAAVLLRPPGLDAFQTDAEPEPPDREP